MKPLIGIPTSTSVSRSGGGDVPRFHSNQAYAQAISAAGGVPVLLPLITDTEVVRAMCGRIDGLLLPGGADVEPWRYGAIPGPHLGSTDPAKDEVEALLIEWSLASDKPLLAICRGQQMLNVAMGGGLYQHLPNEHPSQVPHRNPNAPRDHLAHSITIERDSKLASILQVASAQVNSLHHQAIKTLASGLVATAHAPDGVIEGVESRSHRFVVGVQFHPEELYQRDREMKRLFTALVEQAGLEVRGGR